jgi:hypothetical protein
VELGFDPFGKLTIACCISKCTSGQIIVIVIVGLARPPYCVRLLVGSPEDRMVQFNKGFYFPLWIFYSLTGWNNLQAN